MEKRIIVTIGRQYGSGGREIGEKLSKALGLPYYDKDLIALAAEKSGMSKELLESVDEKATNPFLYSLAIGSSVRGRDILTDYNLPINDQLFIVQSQVIKDLAQKENCIIVGRCADSVLKDDPALISVFVYADMEARVARIMQRQNLPYEKAKKLVAKTDKQRRTYYNYYADKQWGDLESYALCLDSTKLGIEGTVKVIEEYIRVKTEQ